MYHWPIKHKRPLCLTGLAIKVAEDHNNADLSYLSWINVDKSLFSSFNLISKLKTLLYRSCQVLMKRKIHLSRRSPVSPARLSRNLDWISPYKPSSCSISFSTTMVSSGSRRVPGSSFGGGTKTKPSQPKHGEPPNPNKQSLRQHNQHPQNQFPFDYALARECNQVTSIMLLP